MVCWIKSDIKNTGLKKKKIQAWNKVFALNNHITLPKIKEYKREKGTKRNLDSRNLINYEDPKERCPT